MVAQQCEYTWCELYTEKQPEKRLKFADLKVIMKSWNDFPSWSNQNDSSWLFIKYSLRPWKSTKDANKRCFQRAHSPVGKPRNHGEMGTEIAVVQSTNRTGEKGWLWFRDEGRGSRKSSWKKTAGAGLKWTLGFTKRSQWGAVQADRRVNAKVGNIKAHFWLHATWREV